MEVSFHRILRMSVLFIVISLGLFNSAQCNILYTLIMEHIFIFVFFVSEATFHILLIWYVQSFDKFAAEQRRKGEELARKTNAANRKAELDIIKVNLV